MIDFKDKENESLLLIASKNGHTETVKALIKAGADVNFRKQKTALRMASHNGNTEIVKALLEAKADVHEKPQDVYGWTAFLEASFNGHDEIVKLLLEYGADVNSQLKDKRTALMLALELGYIKAIEVNGLLNSVVDVDATSLEDDNKRQKNTIELLLKAGAVFNKETKKKLLEFASEHGHPGVIEILSKHKDTF